MAEPEAQGIRETDKMLDEERDDDDLKALEYGLPALLSYSTADIWIIDQIMEAHISIEELVSFHHYPAAVGGAV
jgi:hypothetical protein